MNRNSFSLLVLLIVLLLGNGCAHSLGVQYHPAPWKFVVISDTQGADRGKADQPGINEPFLRAIAQDLAVERPDFVLVAGDLVNGWTWSSSTSFGTQYANWKSAMGPVYRLNIPVYPLRGNHDVGPERVALPPLPARMEPPPGAAVQLEQAFKNAFDEPYTPRNGPKGEESFTFSFTHKNAFIVGLDVCGNHQHKVNQGWLDREFIRMNRTRPRKPGISGTVVAGGDNVGSHERRTHVFVYAHEPAFEVRHRDCLAYYREDRDTFWDALGRAGSRIYFCGHDHLYNRAVISDSAGNQIRQIVAGTGGGRLVQWSGAYKEEARVKGEYSNSEHLGYVLVTVDGPRATVAWKGLVSQEGINRWYVFDTFSYTLP